MSNRNPMPRDVARFRKACRDLKRLAESGWTLYLSGTGDMHLMSGPSPGSGGCTRASSHERPFRRAKFSE